MWAMMESEIESGEKSPSDPIYSKAMRQWSIHQSVMKHPDIEMVKHKPSAAAAASDSTSPRAGTGTPTAATAASVPSVAIPTSHMELDRIRKSILRLERTLVSNGWAHPKLPSPLNDLQYLKEQMTTAHFDIHVRPLYEREIGKYLTSARHQARHSTAPAHLPALLDGIDCLRSTDQPSQMLWTLKETYDFVLRAYLALLEDRNPVGGAGLTAGGVGGPRPKRKRDDSLVDGQQDEEVADADLDRFKFLPNIGTGKVHLYD